MPKFFKSLFGQVLMALLLGVALAGLLWLLKLSKLVMPVLSSLEAETTMTDVQYDTDHMSSAVNSDGSVNVRLPSSIGELRFDTWTDKTTQQERIKPVIRAIRIELLGNSKGTSSEASNTASQTEPSLDSCEDIQF